jgi:molybdate transport system substrate-binding protein
VTTRIVTRIATALAVVILGCGLAASLADAAELKVLTTRAGATVLDEIAPQFERMTGYRLSLTVDLGAPLVARVMAGEAFDVLIALPAQLDALIKDGTIDPQSRTSALRSGIGVEVRAGAAKPDIASVESFRRALLDAKSVAYLKRGASGIYLAGLMQRLGIADAIKAKLTLPDGDVVSELVAKGEVELGMVVATQILTTPGVELVGPLPPDIQHYVVFDAGVSASSQSPAAANALVELLKGPVAAPVIKRQGMEPG